MVIVSSGLDQAEEFALDYFDSMTFMAIGDDNNAEIPSDTALGNELLRDPIDVKVKDLGNGTYDFTATFELSDAAGETIREVAIFDAGVGGTMGMRKILPIEISKTANQQIEITVRIGVTASNIFLGTTDNLTVDTGDNLTTDTGDNLVVNTI